MFKKVFKIIRNILMITTILLLTISILLTFAGIVIYKTKIIPYLDEINVIVEEYAEQINDEPFTLIENTIIYDSQGDVLSSINVSNNINIKFEQLPTYLVEGYVAVEDRNFWEHNGYDIKAILRAGVEIIKNKGSITQGGSTITQQVLKNNILQDIESKFERKIIEIFLAPKLEEKLTKEEIMVSYLNTIYYGNRCYGIASASKYYFDKNIEDITISEAAILIGLPNSPTRYNPATNPEETLQKRNRVLKQMFDYGVITFEEYEQAYNETPTYTFTRDARNIESYPTSFAIHKATLLLMGKMGFEFEYVFSTQNKYEDYKTRYTELYKSISDNIRQGGYRIYTSLNIYQQQLLQSQIDTVLSTDNTLTSEDKYNFQGSATLVSNTTNMITAIVGGRTEEDEYNRAYQSARQPGSIIKPLLIYGPAYSTGLYTPSSVLKDEKPEDATNIINDPNYFPSNADNKYRGSMTIREAVARSVNTIPYSLGLEFGSSFLNSFLSKMKFSHLTNEDYYNNALSIGGFTLGTNTSEIAGLYNMIVNEGNLMDENFIVKITDQNGNLIYENPKTTSEIFNEDVAYLLLDTLREPFESSLGTARAYKIADQYQIGKTGTTNNNKDSWLVGATPYYTLAVWVGYDYPKEIQNASTYSGTLYKNIMTQLHLSNEKVDFNRPSTIEEHYVDSKGKLSYTKTNKTDIFSGIALNLLREKQDELQYEEQMKSWETIQDEFKNLQTSSKNIATYSQYTNYKTAYDKIKSYIDNTSKYDLIKEDIEEEMYQLLVQLEEINHNVELKAQPIITQYKEEEQRQKQVNDLLKLSSLLSSYQTFLQNKSEIETLLNTYKSIPEINEYKEVYNNYSYLYEQEQYQLLLEKQAEEQVQLQEQLQVQEDNNEDNIEENQQLLNNTETNLE